MYVITNVDTLCHGKISPWHSIYIASFTMFFFHVNDSLFMVMRTVDMINLLL